MAMMSDETKPRNFCVRQGERTLNVTRYKSGDARVHVGGLDVHGMLVEVNDAQAQRLAAYLDPRAAAIESAARAFMAAVGETSDDIPGHLRPTLLLLRVALADTQND